MSSAPRPYTLRLVLLFLCPLPIPYGSSAHLNALSFSAFSLSLSPTWSSTPLDLLRSPFRRVSFSKLLRELSISCASRPLCIQRTQAGCCCPVAPENRGNARVTVMREFCNCARRKRGGVAWRGAAWRGVAWRGVAWCGVVCTTRGYAACRAATQGWRRQKGGLFPLQAHARGPRKTIPRVDVKT